MTHKTALMFPGQGAQVVGMAKDFYGEFRESRVVFEEASDAIGVNLTRLCFDGPLETLTLTENLQPSLFTSEVALHAALSARIDLDVGAYLGHSLGEYAALTAAGCLSVADGARLTRLRGTAMQEAVPVGTGAMAAIIGLDSPQVEALCILARTQTKLIVEPANFNAPGQIVISGAKDAVACVSAIIASDASYRRVKFIQLQVSAPFHCSLMAPAQKRMHLPLLNTAFRKPSAPLIANIVARAIHDEREFPGLLSDQIVGAVRWQSSIELLPNLGIERCIEIGPGTVLTGLLKRINKDLKSLSVSSIETMKASFS